MSYPRCHRCEKTNGLIIMDDGRTLCPFCYVKSEVSERPLPKIIRNKLRFRRVIDPRGTLDHIGAQLMVNFLVNGMTLTDVARQMGITRATVYAQLRRYGLIRPDDEDKPRLQPTLSDVAHAGGTLSRMKIKSVT